MPPWPSSRNQSLSTAGLLRCMPYFTKCTESLDGKTPVTFLLSQDLEIYFRWQILTRVVNFCPYQICSCPCDTKLKLIPQYSWVQAASRFYNHVPRTLLNRCLSLSTNNRKIFLYQVLLFQKLHKVFIAVSDPLGRKYRCRGISGSVLGVCKGK